MKAWTPARLNGLAIWLDVGRITGLSDGAAVATWPDASGYGRNAAQANGTMQPLYKTNILSGKPAVLFDGTNDHLFTAAFSSALTQPTTVFVVSKRNSPDSTQRHMIDGVSSTGRNIIFDSGGTANFNFFAGNVVTGTARDANAHVFSAVFNGASSVLRKDGTQIASGDVGAQALTGLAVATSNAGAGGVGNYWLGYIAEIIIYNANQTAFFGTVERYLGARYGITVA